MNSTDASPAKNDQEEDPLDAFMRTLEDTGNATKQRGEILNFEDEEEDANKLVTGDSSDEEVDVDSAVLKMLKKKRKLAISHDVEEIAKRPAIIQPSKEKRDVQVQSEEEDDEEEDIIDKEATQRRITIPSSFDWNAMLASRTKPAPIDSKNFYTSSFYSETQNVISSPASTRRRLRLHVRGFNVPRCILSYEDLAPSLADWPGYDTFVRHCAGQLISPSGLEAQLIPCLLSQRSCYVTYDGESDVRRRLFEIDKGRALRETSFARISLCVYIKSLCAALASRENAADLVTKSEQRVNQLVLCANDRLALQITRSLIKINDWAQNRLKISLVTDAAEKSVNECFAVYCDVIVITQHQLNRWFADGQEDYPLVSTVTVLCLRGDPPEEHVIDSSILRITQLALPSSCSYVLLSDHAESTIEAYAEKYLSRCIRIQCDNEDIKYLQEFPHRFFNFRKEVKRINWLEGALPKLVYNGTVLIFCNTETRAVDVACLLKQTHPSIRVDVLKWADVVDNGSVAIRASVAQCLITSTPVAIKGLKPIHQIKFRTVINYDFPRSVFEYRERAMFIDNSTGTAEVFTAMVYENPSDEVLIPTETNQDLPNKYKHHRATFTRLADVAGDLVAEFARFGPDFVPEPLKDIGSRSGKSARPVQGATEIRSGTTTLPLFQASHGLEPVIDIPQLQESMPLSGIDQAMQVENDASEDADSDYVCDDAPHTAVTFKHPEPLLLPVDELRRRRHINLTKFVALITEWTQCVSAGLEGDPSISVEKVSPLEWVPNQDIYSGGGVGFGISQLPYTSDGANAQSAITDLNPAAAAILAKVNARHEQIKKGTV